MQEKCSPQDQDQSKLQVNESYCCNDFYLLFFNFISEKMGRPLSLVMLIFTSSEEIWHPLPNIEENFHCIEVFTFKY